MFALVRPHKTVARMPLTPRFLSSRECGLPLLQILSSICGVTVGLVWLGPVLPHNRCLVVPYRCFTLQSFGDILCEASFHILIYIGYMIF